MEKVTIVEGNEGEYSALQGWIGRDLTNRTVVQRLRLPLMADDLLADLAEYERLRMPIVEQLQDDRFDEAWYSANEEKQVLTLRRGACVLQCFLSVPEDLREHLDLFAEAMNVEVRLPESQECGEYHGWWR